MLATAPTESTPEVSTLAAAVTTLLDADLTRLSDAEVLDTLCGIECATRQLGHAVHQLLVAIEERFIPASRGHKTVKKLLIELLRISSADAGARVAAAKDLGTWHTLTGQDLPVTLPDTAAAQRDGEIGADHARTIRNVIRKIPDAVPAQERALAETTLARLATTATPEDVDRVGDRILAHLDPDGTLPDERDRTRRRGITLGRQDTAAMSPLSGHLIPDRPRDGRRRAGQIRAPRDEQPRRSGVPHRSRRRHRSRRVGRCRGA